MKKRTTIYLFLLILLFIEILVPRKVEAFDCSFSTDPDPIYITSGDKVNKIRFTFNYPQNNFITALKSSQLGGKVLLKLSYPQNTSVKTIELGTIASPSDLNKFASNPIDYTYELNFFTSDGPVFRGDHQAWVEYQDTSGNLIPICDRKDYSVLDKEGSCKIIADHDGLGDIDSNFWVTISNLVSPSSYNLLDIVFDSNLDDSIRLDPVQPPNTLRVDIPKSYIKSNINSDREHTVQVFPAKSLGRDGKIPRGDEMCRTTYKVALRGATPILNSPTPFLSITPTPTIRQDCGGSEGYKAQERGDCSSRYLRCPWCITPTPKSKKKTPGPTLPPLVALCEQLTDSEPKGKDSYRKQCKDCVGYASDKPTGKLWTAIGCVPIDYSGFISKVVLGTGVGIAGGVAFLYFLYGAFMILTSTGNAEKLEEAKQIITSALAGLILIIFSVFLLKTIGVDILQLRDFS